MGSLIVKHLVCLSGAERISIKVGEII